MKFILIFLFFSFIYGRNNSLFNPLPLQKEKEKQQIIPQEEKRSGEPQERSWKPVGSYGEYKYEFDRDAPSVSGTDKIPQTVMKKPSISSSSGGGGGGGGGKAKHTNPPSNAVPDNNGSVKELDKWWPVCIFVDPKVKNANSLLKGMVDMAAKCGVAVAAFPQYINDYPNDPDRLKKLLREKCNAIEALSNYGVSNASVMALVATNNIHLKMCKAQDPNHTRFCSEFSVDPGPGMKHRLLYQGKWGGVAPKGESAVSIVGPAGFDPVMFSTAALCQPLLNYPPGYGAGNACGLVDEGYSSAGVTGKEGWTPPGCERMLEMANPNKINYKYSSSQKLYIPPVSSNMHFFDLYGKRKMFPVSGEGITNGISSLGGQGGGKSSGGQGGGSSGGGSLSGNVSSGGSTTGISNNLPTSSLPERIAISEPDDFFKSSTLGDGHKFKLGVDLNGISSIENASKNNTNSTTTSLTVMSEEQKLSPKNDELEKQNIFSDDTFFKNEEKPVESTSNSDFKTLTPTSSSSSTVSPGLDPNFFDDKKE